ncbi:MAG: hypothetical protein H0X02_04570 [Nitrosomonas sp.]|nr:hypothetical protein [Nitrosomonas sp.]
MASSTQICNIAIGHLGSGKEIGSLEEKSQEAAICRRFYQISLEATLRDYSWPFATKIATLALIEETPNLEWSFSYRFPSDCLNIRKILSGVRNDTRQSRVPYKIGQDDGGLLLFTDQSLAQAEYTIIAPDTSRFPPDFVMAFSFRLASYLAPSITGGDPYRLGDKCFKLYAVEIDRAKASAMNEEQTDEEPESEFIRARD